MSKIKKIYIGEDRETFLFHFEDDSLAEFSAGGGHFDPSARPPSFWTEVDRRGVLAVLRVDGGRTDASALG